MNAFKYLTVVFGCIAAVCSQNYPVLPSTGYNSGTIGIPSNPIVGGYYPPINPGYDIGIPSYGLGSYNSYNPGLGGYGYPQNYYGYSPYYGGSQLGGYPGSYGNYYPSNSNSQSSAQASSSSSG